MGRTLVIQCAFRPRLQRPRRPRPPKPSKPVFDLLPAAATTPTLREVREAYEVAQYLKDTAERNALYCTFDMDGPAVEKYLGTVEGFERSLRLDPRPRFRYMIGDSVE